MESQTKTNSIDKAEKIYKLVLECIRKKFTGKLLIEINFSNGGIANAYQDMKQQV